MKSNVHALKEKEQIMKELFRDVNSKQCVLELYIISQFKDNKISQVSNESDEFLKKMNKELLREYNNGNILFFRKYNYEKILNTFLQKKYQLDVLDMKIFADEKKREQILKEKQILNSLSKLKWSKTIKIGSILYEAVDEYGETIKLCYPIDKNKQPQKGSHKLTYDNKTIKYINYDSKKIVDIIEKTHPVKNIKNSIIIANGKKQTSLDSHNIRLISQKTEMDVRKIEDLTIKFQKQCKYYNKNGKKNNCTMLNKSCSVFSNDCIQTNALINSIVVKSKKAVPLPKNAIQKEEVVKNKKSIEEFAGENNLSVETIEKIFKPLKLWCMYRKESACNYKAVPDDLCSFQDTQCLHHQELINNIKKYKNNILKNKEIVNTNKPKSKQKQNMNAIPEIGVRDFVVRTNVFKCMHNKHNINNIAAMINIDNDGKRELVKISAGYCTQCKVYFIMDSTYQNLKRKGVILCRVTDEKNYMKGTYINGMRLAKESLLMQYGYNVSQTEGLTDLRRHKILAVIIDNKIMSKGEIISYLDFFINQRSGMSNMERAIAKWESDREFVEEYKIGQYAQYGVKAIYKR